MCSRTVLKPEWLDHSEPLELGRMELSLMKKEKVSGRLWKTRGSGWGLLKMTITIQVEMCNEQMDT